jgi:chromosome segregation ATPase
MPRTGLVYEQVASVIEAMLAEGLKPSLRSIRERLGTGSSNTIHKYYVQWQDSKPIIAATKIELPKQIVVAILNEIERGINQVRNEMADALAQMKASAEELVTTADQLEADLAEERALVTSLTSEKDIVLGKIEQLNIALTDAQAQAENERHQTEAARIELAKCELEKGTLETTVTVLTVKNERLNSKLESERTAGNNCRERLARLEGQMENISQPVKETPSKVVRNAKKMKENNYF